MTANSTKLTPLGRLAPGAPRAARLTLVLLLATVAAVFPGGTAHAAPANDEVSGALAAPTPTDSQPHYTYDSVTSGATAAASDPMLCPGDAAGAPTVWFKFTAPTKGIVNLSREWQNNEDVPMTVLQGAPGAWRLLSCGVDDTGHVIRLESGEQFFLMAKLPSSDPQRVQFSTTWVSSPANDERANATTITGASWESYEDISAASPNPSDPVSCSGRAGVSTAWWKFEAPTDGTFDFYYDIGWALLPETTSMFLQEPDGALTLLGCTSSWGGTDLELKAGQVVYAMTGVPSLSGGEDCFNFCRVRMAITATFSPPAPSLPDASGEALGPDTATLWWSEPTKLGVGPITGYRVSHDAASHNMNAFSTVLPAGARSFTFRNLLGGKRYQLMVAAIDSAGTVGQTSHIYVNTPPATPPSVPSNVAGTVTSATSGRIDWSPPASTGGSPITGYRVTRDGGSAGGTPLVKTVSAGTRSFNFTKLTRGSTYTFSVAAINALGRGTAGSVTVTPATIPTAPRIGKATSGSPGGAITATAAWSSPSSNGGSPITGYQVRALRMSSTGTVLSTTLSAVQAPAVRALAMTLPAGRYRFAVVAFNAIGTSPHSARSNLVTAR